MSKRKVIIVNVDLASYKKGDRIFYDEAKEDLKFWADNKCIFIEKLICSVVEEESKKDNRNEILFRKIDIPKTQITKESGKTAKKVVVKKTKKYNSKAPRCKGIKKDGYQCRSTKITDNGYCRHHQDQAKQKN